MSENLIERIHKEIQQVQTKIQSNPNLFKKSWENLKDADDSIEALQKHQEIARLILIESINHLLTNSATKAGELTNKHLILLQRINSACTNDIKPWIRINLEKPQNHSKSPQSEDIPGMVFGLAGIGILNFFLLFIIMGAVYLAGAMSVAAFTAYTLPFLILIGASVIIALAALSIAVLNYEPPLVKKNMETLYSNAQHYNAYLITTESFYKIKQTISTNHPDESGDIRAAFKKYQDIMIKNNMIAADPSLMLEDIRLISYANESGVDVLFLAKTIERDDANHTNETEYTKAKKELIQQLLTYAYKEDNTKRFTDDNNEVLNTLKKSSFSPKIVNDYLRRFESIQNRKSHGLFSRSETIADLLKEINECSVNTYCLT